MPNGISNEIWNLLGAPGTELSNCLKTTLVEAGEGPGTGR